MFTSLVALAFLPAMAFSGVIRPRQTQEVVSNGSTYIITNVKSGTVVDISGVDNKAIIGYPSHNGTNQQWKLNWAGNGWTFQAVSNGAYLTYDQDKGASDGANITGVASSSDQPTVWHIWHDEDNDQAYRIFVPNTTQVLDLYARGNPVPGDPITLWYTWSNTHQTWNFTKVA